MAAAAAAAAAARAAPRARGPARTAAAAAAAPCAAGWAPGARRPLRLGGGAAAPLAPPPRAPACADAFAGGGPRGASSAACAPAVHKPQMVDISAKPPTSRRARAACRVLVGAEIAEALAAGAVAKGDVFTVSEVAGIMAAKRTPDFLPLCHPLPLTRAAVECRLDRDAGLVDVVADVACEGSTGVEMESLTAAATAALCIYDMCKPISKGIVITDLRLLSKSGGKSGDYERAGPGAPE